MNEINVLTDGIITLRPFTLEDAEEHLLGEDTEQIKWLSGGKGSLEGVKNWITKNLQYWGKNGPIFNFAITNTNDQLIGMVEANSDYENIEGIEQGDANISYGLYPQFRGQGNASRAVDLITNFLKTKGFKRGVIRTNRENEPSIKVAIACDFEKENNITLNDGEELIVFVKKINE